MKKILHINSVIYSGGGIIKKIIHLIENDKENEHVIFFAWYSDPDNKRSDMIKLLNELGIKFDYIYHNSIWANIPDFYRYLKNHSYDITFSHFQKHELKSLFCHYREYLKYQYDMGFLKH